MINKYDIGKIIRSFEQMFQIMHQKMKKHYYYDCFDIVKNLITYTKKLKEKLSTNNYNKLLSSISSQTNCITRPNYLYMDNELKNLFKELKNIK